MPPDPTVPWLISAAERGDAAAADALFSALYAELRTQYFKHGKVEKIEHRTDLTRRKRGRSGRSVVGTSRNGQTT